MPRGTRHEVAGRLLLEQRWPVVELDGGGRWRLALDPGYERWLGRRVRIEGVRSGFDLLDVVTIAVEGRPDETLPQGRSGHALRLELIVLAAIPLLLALAAWLR